MEIELLENGSRVIRATLESQDITDYIALLDKEVLLVTHFVNPLTTAANVAPPRSLKDMPVSEGRSASPHSSQTSYDKEKNGAAGAASEGAAAAAAAAAAGGNGEEAAVSPGDGRTTAAPSSKQSMAKQSVSTKSGKLSVSAGERKMSKTSGKSRSGSSSVEVPFALEALRVTTDAANALNSTSRHLDDAPSSNFSQNATNSFGKGRTRDKQSSEKRMAEQKEILRRASALAQSCDATVTFGAANVAFHMHVLLSWLNGAKYTTRIDMQLDPRKRVLQDGESLPPIPVPADAAGQLNLVGRQYTEKNQRLSRLVVQWGRQNLVLQDECFFDDGKLLTIHRRIVETPSSSPADAKAVAAERKLFFGEQESRVLASAGISASSSSPHVLDFNFCKLEGALDLLKMKPVAGHAHANRSPQPPKKRAAAPNQSGTAAVELAKPPKGAASGEVMITAKNKNGEEEVYEFNDGPRRGIMDLLSDRRATKSNVMEQLALQLDCKYDAECVRASGCGLREVEHIVPVLRRMVTNTTATLQWLDLSQNNIQSLPSLAALPLVRLYLHGNKISKWEDVEKAICPLPLLQSLTLHGNPISDNDATYRENLIARLLCNPNRQRPLCNVDFSTVTPQDYNIAAVYASNKFGVRPALQLAWTLSAQSTSAIKLTRNELSAQLNKIRSGDSSK